MADPSTPRKHRIPSQNEANRAEGSTASPTRSTSGVSRLRHQKGATASPQVKAALAALRKNRQPATASPSSFNSVPPPRAASSSDPFSTPVRTKGSNGSEESTLALSSSLHASRNGSDDGTEWAKKSEYRLIEGAKKTGLLNLSSQGLESVPSAVYSALLPRSSPYHPSQRNRSTYREEPTVDLSMSRNGDETPWYEQRDLKSLNLANNELAQLEDSVGGFEELEFFDVHNNLLTSIPSSVGWLVNLTSLNLCSNSLTSFPLEITNIPYLRDLDLSHNKLPSLWPTDWRDQLSQTLVPPEKSPTATPESPERIPNDGSRSFLEAFSNSPFRKRSQESAESPSTCRAPFPVLQDLALAGNPFERSVFTKEEGFAFPRRLKSLDLSQCQLVDTSLPPHLVARLQDLVTLDLSDNGFTEDLFSLDLFSLASDDSTSSPSFPSLRTLDLSLNPIDHLGSIESFLTTRVSRPIEYVGLSKPIYNLVKSEETRLRKGLRIGVNLPGTDDGTEAEESVCGVEVEVKVRECIMRGEQDRRRAKFAPSSSSTRPRDPVDTLRNGSSTSTSASASPSSSPPRTSPSHLSNSETNAESTTPLRESHASSSSRRQVVLEPWEIEAAAGLSTPAGKRKAAAQAARERAERTKREEEEQKLMKEKLVWEKEEMERKREEEESEKKAREEERLARELDHLTLERAENTDSPPSPSTVSHSYVIDAERPSLPPADPSDPALQLVGAALDASTRSINLSNRSLDKVPTLSNGDPPSSLSNPLTLDVSRNSLKSLPLAQIAAWSSWSTSLRNLNLSHNRMAGFDSTVDLPNVTDLNLSHNNFTSSSGSTSILARIAESFPSVTHLSLSYNRLENLEGIDQLLLISTSAVPNDEKKKKKMLKVLELNGNRISDLNGLCRVGEAMEKERQTRGKESEKEWTLEQLDLSDNEIARLPPTLGLLPHSLILSVSGNTFRFPRREVWDNPGARSLLPVLRERLG